MSNGWWHKELNLEKLIKKSLQKERVSVTFEEKMYPLFNIPGCERHNSARKTELIEDFVIVKVVILIRTSLTIQYSWSPNKQLSLKLRKKKENHKIKKHCLVSEI